MLLLSLTFRKELKLKLMSKLTDENCIALICNGEFNAIPDFKIGRLFESFFENINYNVVTIDGKKYVDFTGEAECDDEDATVLIRFTIFEDEEEFEISEVKVGDRVLDEEETIDLLEDIALTSGADIEDLDTGVDYIDDEDIYNTDFNNYDYDDDISIDDDDDDDDENSESDDDDEDDD